MSIDPLSILAPGSAGPAADPVPRPASGSARAAAEPAVPQMRPTEVNASFGPDNLIIYRIVDKQTGDIIQQIPPEQLLAIARDVRHLLEAAAKTAGSLDVTL